MRVKVKQNKPIDIDGRTGEGGGQLVRVAIALSAVTGQPVRITNIRGNRPRGGGLKSQHATAIEYLSSATSATTSGLSVGSKTLTFHPSTSPSPILAASRYISIAADSPSASALLIFQAVLPYLIFRGSVSFDNDTDREAKEEREDGAGPKAEQEPITLTISGGSNVSFAPSWEYADQVLLPALRSRFGLQIEGQLLRRGWSLGPKSQGAVRFRIVPLQRGQSLQPRHDATSLAAKVFTAADDDPVITRVDVSVITPAYTHDEFTLHLTDQLGARFPGADVEFKVLEDSGDGARVYVLLVARSRPVRDGDEDVDLRWGRDVLTSIPKKGGKAAAQKFSSLLVRKLVAQLGEEVDKRCVCDQYLEDQLVVFQALAQGTTSCPRFDAPEEDVDGTEDNGVKRVTRSMEGLGLENERLRKDKTHDPFGLGTLHSQTARWVASEMLPGVEWYNKGTICKAIGLSAGGMNSMNLDSWAVPP
ncbi:EPT/RTPC-like protein [Sodiomyces alkalinus F11]|uniref:EPT/RTPC-like protein n=1 Tax=Sodiomyces alkalinus (strain CBS 110278 / VKM F-3762 / F11) TaxID=1314773 RepID=A0A3N2PLN3_SODAK|nr:EPT/RTPC-like protein [Sodiomyces alkalinus F11]ROT35435.1 EPT/RTPC-like protein [Sodiomyces alkalinus F11]